MVMNKFNLLAVLSLALAVAALSYAALSPVAMASRQDMIVKGASGTAGQAGTAGQDLIGHSVTNYQGKSNDVQNGNRDTNQRNGNNHDSARVGHDGTNGQNGNGADGTNGQNGVNGSPVESSNDYDRNLNEDFSTETN